MSIQEQCFHLFLDDSITKISKMETFVKSQLLKKNVNFKKDSEINHELRRTFRLSFFRSKLNTMDHQLISINNLVKKKFYSEIHVSGIINVKYYKFFFIFMNQ
ncbi:unnamed protein product [Rangifer tarandus platyrhynchus]|uniref:Uncharacterized protein n=1 Tax=Rangifer tarandus platyrhynchus TaxID=3082113 RepID=A0ABN8Y9I5_RANTA|nr:unnamed protein product [Rangifer tarandus platyrhynchus]